MKKLLIFFLCIVVLSWCSNNNEELEVLKNKVQELEDWIVALHWDNIVTQDNISRLHEKTNETNENLKQTSNILHKYIKAKEWCIEKMEYIERIAIVDTVVYQWDWVYVISYYPIDWRWEIKNDYTTKKIEVWSIVCK